MKRVLLLTILFFLGTTMTFSQGNQSNPTNASSTVSRVDERSHHTGWEWVGIFGLAGLGGLFRRANSDTLRERNTTDVRTAA